MAVYSREIPDDDQPPGPRRSPALFRRAAFHRQQTNARRTLALVLVLVSVTGALLWGGGGSAPWLALSPNWWGVAGALALQGLLTWGQWVFGGPTWWNPPYLLCLGGSAATTVAGYWPLMHKPFTGWIAAQAGAETSLAYYAPWLAGGIIVAAALYADWLPEQELLD